MWRVGRDRVAGVDVGEGRKSSGGGWVFVADGGWYSAVGVLSVGFCVKCEE